jgi:hypothetical protein
MIPRDVGARETVQVEGHDRDRRRARLHDERARLQVVTHPLGNAADREAGHADRLRLGAEVGGDAPDRGAREYRRRRRRRSRGRG